MEVKQENFELIEEFSQHCNEIIDGKFILADMKIANLFKFIDGKTVLCDLFARALNGFNFDKEFAKSKISNGLNGYIFRMPEDNVRIIALVYSLLQDANFKKIDLYSFVNTYFEGGQSGNTNLAFNNFCLKVVVPFRDTVISALEDKFEIAPADKNLEPEIITEDEVLDGFEKLELIIDQILDSINYEPKIKEEQKQELYIVLKGLKQAARMRSLTLIGSIAIGLDYLIKKVKSAKYFYAELQDCLAELY